MTRHARRKPLDPDLYESVVEEAKARFAVWPSAYASGWVVRTYKERGGRYAGQGRSERTGLTKWFGEEWVDLSRPIYDEDGELVGYEPCGRERGGDPADYPKCRPLKEAMRMSPRAVKDAVRRKRRAEAGAPARGMRARPPKRAAPYRKNPEYARGDEPVEQRDVKALWERVNAKKNAGWWLSSGLLLPFDLMPRLFQQNGYPAGVHTLMNILGTDDLDDELDLERYHVNSFAYWLENLDKLASEPLELAADDELMDGHHRLAAAVARGLRKVPVVVLKPRENPRAFMGRRYRMTKNPRPPAILEDYMPFYHFRALIAERESLAEDARIRARYDVEALEEAREHEAEIERLEGELRAWRERR